MGSLRVRYATTGDAARLAPHLRQRDVDECHAAAHLAPFEALYASLMHADKAYAATDTEGIVALFGVSLNHDGSGAPWMLGAERLSNYRREMVAYGRDFVGAWMEHYGRLSNYVDARADDSVRYLGHLGFEIHPAAPYGPDGLPFHHFTMGA